MDNDDKFLRLPEVCASVGLQKVAIYNHIKKGDFPKPVKFGRTSFWPESHIRAWKDGVITASGGSS